MGFIWESARKDLARWWQDKPNLGLSLAIPLLIGGLLTSMMGGAGGARPTGELLVADLDGSLLSGFMAGAYSQGELGEIITVKQVTEEEGARAIAAGEASGFLLIPDGFGQALLDNTPVTLTLRTNPAQTLLPGIIQDATEILLDLGFYAQQVLGDEIRRIKNFDELTELQEDVFVAAIAVQISNKLDAVVPNLVPPQIEVNIVEPPAAEPRPNLAVLFLPGVVLMAILFFANNLAADFWTERENGTLRRLVSTPGQLTPFVAGKAVAAALALAAVAAVVLLAGFMWHGLPWSKLPVSIAWVTLGGVALFAWFSVLQMLFSNRKAANLVSTLLLFPLLMLGGSFFPLDVLPETMAMLGRLSPNGFLVSHLGAELTSNAAALGFELWLGIVAALIAGLLLCSWRLGNGFARS